MKKIFLTSALCMAFTAPALADIAANASGATCNTDTLGIDSGSATLEAQWDANTYSCDGEDAEYLRASDATCQVCPANYYCENPQNATFTGSDIGLYACPSEFPYSEGSGAYSSEYCYKTETVACSSVNPYTGGHGSVAKYSGVAAANATTTQRRYNDEFDTVEPDESNCVITELNCDTGYHQETGPLDGYDISGIDSLAKYKSISGAGENYNSSGLSNGQWQVDSPDEASVKGIAKCSSTPVGSFAEAGTPSDTGGKYCWVKITGYTTDGNTWQSVDKEWRGTYDEFSSQSDCENNCLSEMNGILGASGFSDFAADLTFPISCIANTINLDWDPKNGGTHTTNSCTYDGTITLPEQPSKTGYSFNGWKVKTN